MDRFAPMTPRVADEGKTANRFPPFPAAPGAPPYLHVCYHQHIHEGTKVCCAGDERCTRSRSPHSKPWPPLPPGPPRNRRPRSSPRTEEPESEADEEEEVGEGAKGKGKGKTGRGFPDDMMGKGFRGGAEGKGFTGVLFVLPDDPVAHYAPLAGGSEFETCMVGGFYKPSGPDT